MDFLMELIFEIILEGLFHVTIGNQRIKLWVRTCIFILFSQALTVLFTIIGFEILQEGNNGGYIILAIAAAWGIGMLIAAIYGHRKGWPKNEI